jgi:succinyl-CoA synthetase alpha subunit
VTILADANTKVVVQGITGRQASWSTADMAAYGTSIVAGVVPGRGGTAHMDIPLFDYVDDAVRETGAEASVVFVPASVATGAIIEAMEAGIRLVIYPGDGLPIHDALVLRERANILGVTFIGPNTPGVISPGQCKLGFMPSYCYTMGSLGVVSKSGSLSYELCWRLTSRNIGQSTVVGIGGDPIKGLRLGETLDLFDRDDQTRAVLVLGEIGGLDEYDVVEYVKQPLHKPVLAFLVGKTAPPGRKLGHAGAFIGSDREGYASKVAALTTAGIAVAQTMAATVDLAAAVIDEGGQ